MNEGGSYPPTYERKYNHIEAKQRNKIYKIPRTTQSSFKNNSLVGDKKSHRREKKSLSVYSIPVAFTPPHPSVLRSRDSTQPISVEKNISLTKTEMNAWVVRVLYHVLEYKNAKNRMKLGKTE